MTTISRTVEVAAPPARVSLVGGVVTGVRDREAFTARSIEHTLARLQEQAVAPPVRRPSQGLARCTDRPVCPPTPRRDDAGHALPTAGDPGRGAERRTGVPA